MYGDPNIGKVKSAKGKFHAYLSITLDYTTNGEVKMYIRKYVKNTIEQFPTNTKESKAVTISETEKWNYFIQQWLEVFLMQKSKNTHTNIAVLFNRVKHPN